MLYATREFSPVTKTHDFLGTPPAPQKIMLYATREFSPVTKTHDFLGTPRG
jgi:hypothetical protein